MPMVFRSLITFIFGLYGLQLICTLNRCEKIAMQDSLWELERMTSQYESPHITTAPGVPTLNFLSLTLSSSATSSDLHSPPYDLSLIRSYKRFMIVNFNARVIVNVPIVHLPMTFAAVQQRASRLFKQEQNSAKNKKDVLHLEQCDQIGLFLNAFEVSDKISPNFKQILGLFRKRHF